MQSLISPVDHESRHNSHRTEDVEERNVSEDTPLLHRFPVLDTTHRNPVTTVVVTFLLIILLSGVIIGIYLLVLQSRAENVLPPVESPLQLVSREQWEPGAPPPPAASPREASQVIVVHTGSGQCHTTTACFKLLREMRNQTVEGQVPLPYNFLISSNGQTYEALGWHRPSPLFPQHSASALVLAFIGNYTRTPPSPAQLEKANDFFAESVSRRYLSPSYIIFGKNTKDSPKYLFTSMESLPQWRKDLSDAGSK